MGFAVGLTWAPIRRRAPVVAEELGPQEAVVPKYWVDLCEPRLPTQTSGWPRSRQLHLRYAPAAWAFD
jgi:hypothetical protein